MLLTPKKGLFLSCLSFFYVLVPWQLTSSVKQEEVIKDCTSVILNRQQNAVLVLQFCSCMEKALKQNYIFHIINKDEWMKKMRRLEGCMITERMTAVERSVKKKPLGLPLILASSWNGPSVLDLITPYAYLSTTKYSHSLFLSTSKKCAKHC